MFSEKGLEAEKEERKKKYIRKFLRKTEDVHVGHPLFCVLFSFSNNMTYEINRYLEQFYA